MSQAAESGLPLAQHGLGIMYLYGECVDASPATAVECFERAAGQGLVGSLTTLGIMYKQGQGVAIDEPKARALLSEAGFSDEEIEAM